MTAYEKFIDALTQRGITLKPMSSTKVEKNRTLDYCMVLRDGTSTGNVWTVMIYRRDDDGSFDIWYQNGDNGIDQAADMVANGTI